MVAGFHRGAFGAIKADAAAAGQELFDGRGDGAKVALSSAARASVTAMILRRRKANGLDHATTLLPRWYGARLKRLVVLPPPRGPWMRGQVETFLAGVRMVRDSGVAYAHVLLLRLDGYVQKFNACFLSRARGPLNGRAFGAPGDAALYAPGAYLGCLAEALEHHFDEELLLDTAVRLAGRPAARVDRLPPGGGDCPTSAPAPSFASTCALWAASFETTYA